LYFKHKYKINGGFVRDQVFAKSSAALSCLVLLAGLHKPDPNHEASKKALEHKKEIDKRLGCALIQTNPYKGCVCVKVSVFVEKFGFVFAFFDLGFF